MEKVIETRQALESSTIGIYRTATVVKGGRRFSFSAMVVVGDRHGSAGLGYGKATGVPAAIEKAEKAAKKNLCKVSLKDGTIPHPVHSKFGASYVTLIPAAPGTGVIAGGTVRAVLEMIGVRDCLTKAYGSTNQKNLCKATLQGLKMLRSKEDVAQLRGVQIESSVVEDLLAAGQRYAPAVAVGDQARAKGPVNTVGQQKGGGRRGRGGRGRGGGGGGRRGGGGDRGQGAPVAPVTGQATEVGAVSPAQPQPAADAGAPGPSASEGSGGS